MKKILISGANSYIGTSFEKYIKENYPDQYSVDTIDMIDGSWRDKCFFGYDSVFHVAGIAHQKETRKNRHLYYAVNRDLAIETAKKAKSDGVRQFIFLSSMSIYGKETGVIGKDTVPKPKSAYGQSKLQAEQEISILSDEDFLVCILRPPMVYGKNCKGNFSKIKTLAKKTPVFPYVKNERSLIYIDNLSSFVRKCVDDDLSGVYFPQNREYICTMDMARIIARALNRKIHFDRLMGLAVRLLGLVSPTAKKAFGSLVYQATEEFDFSYILVDNEQSIINSV